MYHLLYLNYTRKFYFLSVSDHSYLRFELLRRRFYDKNEEGKHTTNEERVLRVVCDITRILLLLLFTSNGFVPGGSGTTIHKITNTRSK